MLKENGYQESIISKIFKRILTITACLSHSNKLKTDIIEEETRMNIHLPYVEGTSEKLWAYPYILQNKIHFLH